MRNDPKTAIYQEYYAMRTDTLHREEPAKI